MASTRPSTYNIAMSYQALGERVAAVSHFKRAIVLGLSGKGVEPFLMQNTVIASLARGTIDERGLPVKIDILFDASDIAAVADNTFLRCALASTIIRGVTLELFLTGLRHALLRLAMGNISDPTKVADNVLDLFCALGQQCFLNEYVYAQTADETQGARNNCVRCCCKKCRPVAGCLRCCSQPWRPISRFMRWPAQRPC